LIGEAVLSKTSPNAEGGGGGAISRLLAELKAGEVGAGSGVLPTDGKSLSLMVAETNTELAKLVMAKRKKDVEEEDELDDEEEEEDDDLEEDEDEDEDFDDEEDEDEFEEEFDDDELDDDDDDIFYDDDDDE